METKKEIFNRIKDKINNEDLRYLIEYTELKKEAWEQLLKQKPSNEDLRYLIKYTELKKEAEEKLNEEWRRELEYLKQ